MVLLSCFPTSGTDDEKLDVHEGTGMNIEMREVIIPSEVNSQQSVQGILLEENHFSHLRINFIEIFCR